MSSHCALTIIVGVKDANANLKELSARLATAGSPDIQLLFLFAGQPPEVWSAPRGSETVVSSEISLIPELWRDGLLLAQGDRVAFTTAHCLPSADWVKALRAADLTSNVGVGGTIGLDPLCSSVHKAIYLLRYLTIAPPQHARTVADIAADNAVYRRAEILQHPDLLAKGFWEPSFHRRFIAKGLLLSIDPAIKVAYRGQEAAGAFARHRLLHGREYGESRSSEQPLAPRLAYLLASPLVPVVIAIRVTRRAFRRNVYARALPLALPWLLWFIACWSVGEFSGYLHAVFRPAQGGGR